jgi:hypothetical protein
MPHQHWGKYFELNILFMKNLKPHIATFLLIAAMFWLFAPKLVAQAGTNEIIIEQYQEAINQILANPENEYSREEIIHFLSNPTFGLRPKNVHQNLLSEFFILSPTIRLVNWDGSEDAAFDFFNDGTAPDTIVFNFPVKPTWVDTIPQVTATDITFAISEANPQNTARQSTFIATAHFADTSIAATAHILQAPQPQSFIFVSPKYLAVPPEGNAAAQFDIELFNILQWEALPSETWITGPSGPQTGTSVTFDISENDLTTSREATIEIRDVDNHDVKDIISIYQDGSAQAYLTVSPTVAFFQPQGGNVEVMVFTNQPISETIGENPDEMISSASLSANQDTLFLSIALNDSTASRTGTVVVSVDGNPDISQTVSIFQAAPYILLDPREKTISCQGDTFEIAVTAYGFSAYEITKKPDWVTQDTSKQNSIQILADSNDTQNARSGYLVVQAENLPLIKDSVLITQYSCGQPYIILSPETQIVAWHETTTDEPFALISNLVENDNLALEVIGFPDITATFGDNKESVIVTFPQNLSPNARTATIRVFDTSNTQTFSISEIIQTGAQTFLIINPAIQTVGYESGLTNPFQIISQNVNEWELVDNLPDWLTIADSSATSITFEIARNDSTASRESWFTIRDKIDTTIMDSARIYQKAAPQPFLAAAPREQAVSHNGNPTIDFVVTAINVNLWEAVVTDNWISVNASGQNLLSLNVQKNTTFQTRIAEIAIRDTTDFSISDTVFVYQYSAVDTFLLAAPRQQLVGHNGTGNLTFDVTKLNVENWEVQSDSFPDWISLNAKTFDSFNLKIDPNDSLQTRQAVVKIFAPDQPHIYDSVLIYQYSALDTFLLAAPRQQLISQAGNDSVSFDITTANIENWLVDQSTIPQSWIIISNSGSDQLLLDVYPNPDSLSRQATIRIFAENNPDVEDFVTVYQYAKANAFLIATPQEQNISHTGNDSVAFSITRVNTASWEFADTTVYKEWIDFSNIGDSIIQLKVSANELPQSREANITIRAIDDTTVQETVSIYQYSGLDNYLLAAPREHKVFYTDTTVQFAVEVVNIPDNWTTEIIEGADWLEVLQAGENLLEIKADTNYSASTRTGKIRLFAQDYNSADDTVSIFQFATPNPFILLAPREQRVAHTGTDSLNFSVTTVNTGDWEVEAIPGWITLNESAPELLSLDIEENDTLQTRQATIFVRETGNPSVFDSVLVYQYSALDTFLLAAPRERRVPFAETEISFHITKANVNNWVIDPMALPDWIEAGNSTEDTLRLVVLMNPTTETRSANIQIFDQSNTAITDVVEVYQFAADRPYILAAPREKRIAHTGSTGTDFEITRVNVEAWQFTDTTVYQDWIDFYHLADTLRLNITENPLLETRSAIIRIQSTLNPVVMDSVKIFQFSALDRYILTEPREQQAKRYTADTLQFDVLAVNVENLQLEILDDFDMIDADNTALNNGVLSVYVKNNDTTQTRSASIRIFDLQHPEASDTVSVYQDFPYIILRPAAIDSLPWTETVTQISAFSNTATYTVRKGMAHDWYRLSKDSVVWVNELQLSGDDQFYLRVDTNENAFLRRSSNLSIRINNQLASEFWFDQNTQPGTTFPVSGKVLIEGNPQQPLAGVSVILYDSILVTNNEGIYIHPAVPENWIGTVTPLIDTATSGTPYYFLPPRIEITGLGILEPTELEAFSAYKIDPAVTLAPKAASICFGETLAPGDEGYPTASITDTYGSSTYLWTANPPDPVLEGSDTLLMPTFSPKVSTTYTLAVNNFFRVAVDSFRITVNALPETFDFEGEFSVCKNQAGAVYQVSDPQPGVYYAWSLDAQNPGGYFANSSSPYSVAGNIAIINWENISGEYQLNLYAYNEFDCSDAPFAKTIAISNTEAPPPAQVLRKENDNMLYTTDSLANSYQWGWMEKSTSGELTAEYLIPEKNQWYCRLPDGHTFNPSRYYYFVIAYYDDACGSRTFYSPPVSVVEIEDQSYEIFPNPGNGIFNVRLNGKTLFAETVLEVYDISGQIIFKETIKDPKSETIIDLSGRQRGIYLLMIRNGEIEYSSKIIIQ